MERRKKRIIMVRHGQSVGNLNHAFYSERPDYAISLTEKGQKQAFERGEILNQIPGTFVTFCSTHFRTRQTYHQIKKSIGDRVIGESFTPLIREQEWSNSVGKHSDIRLEKERLTWGVFHYRFPGGESCADVLERIELFNHIKLADELIFGEADTILIVGHGMAMRLHAMALLGLSVEDFELLRNPWNCGTYEFEFEFNANILKGISASKPLEFRKNRSHVFEFHEDRIDILGGVKPKIHSDWDEDFA